MSNGKIVQIIGAVVDVEFSRDAMPRVFEALKMQSPELTLEVQQQLGDGIVRTIAMGSTEGVRRGLDVSNTHSAVSVPVGKETLGRIGDKTRIIPGHGEMGDKAALQRQIAMLEGAIKAVQARIKAGDTLQQAIAKKPLKPWAGFAWSFISEDAFTTTLYNGLKK